MATSLQHEVSPRVRGRFLMNLAEFQTELARVQAGFVPALIVWEQRKELPGLVLRIMRRVQDLRGRGRELGVSFAEMHCSEADEPRSFEQVKEDAVRWRATVLAEVYRPTAASFAGRERDGRYS